MNIHEHRPETKKSFVKITGISKYTKMFPKLVKALKLDSYQYPLFAPKNNIVGDDSQNSVDMPDGRSINLFYFEYHQ